MLIKNRERSNVTSKKKKQLAKKQFKRMMSV